MFTMGILSGLMMLFWGISILMTGVFNMFGPILIAVGMMRILSRLKERRARERRDDFEDDFETYHFKDEAEILAEKYEGKKTSQYNRYRRTY